MSNCLEMNNSYLFNNQICEGCHFNKSCSILPLFQIGTESQWFHQPLLLSAYQRVLGQNMEAVFTLV